MKPGQWTIGLAVALLAVSTGVPAQDQSAYGGYIESEGVATVEVAPDYVEFWLQKTIEGAAAAEVVYVASQLEEQLDEQLKSSELPTPSSFTISEPSLADVNHPAGKASAQLVFPARPYAAPRTGLGDFAALCDGVVALAKTLGCTVEGPSYTVAAKDELEQAAVSRAVEQALSPALGAARIMKSRIDSVDTVEVNEIVWNREPESRAPQPQIRRITCTARVRVKYLFSAGS